MFQSAGFRFALRLSVVVGVLMCAGCLTMGRQLLGKLEPQPDKSSVEEATTKSPDSEPSKAVASEKSAAGPREESTLTKPRISDSEREPPPTKSAAEIAETPPQPPSEAKQAPPPKKYGSAKEAAIATARDTPGVSTIILCPFSYDGTWQVIMYSEDEPKPTVREFVWNQAQHVLEPTMTYPATPAELESLHRKYRMMESCELLAYPRSVAAAEKDERSPDKSPVRSEPRKAELVKPSVPESQPGPAREQRAREREEPDSQLAGTSGNPEERQAVMNFISTWKSVWERKDLDTFKSLYHPSFRAGTMVYDQFMESKAKFFGNYQTINVEFERVSVKKVRGGYQVKFLQRFQGDSYRDQGWKTMTLVGNPDRGFKIISEEWSAQ